MSGKEGRIEGKKKEEAGYEYEVNSHRAHLSGYVLLAGLALEIINAVIWYKGLETIAELVAVSLIVGGVWGELFFGRKARIAGDKQLAEYKARAAEAELQLEQVRFPRSLDSEKFETAIKEVSLPPSFEVLYDANAPDASLLAGDIWGALFNAKWPTQQTGGEAPLKAPRPDILPWANQPWTVAAGGGSWGLSVVTNNRSYMEKDGPGDVLVRALLATVCGPRSQVTSGPAHGGDLAANTVRIIVGPKLP
jgi:hypothetical protein